MTVLVSSFTFFKITNNIAIEDKVTKIPTTIKGIRYSSGMCKEEESMLNFLAKLTVL